MAVISADTLQLAHIKEVTAGVTPSTPAFKLWRTAGETVTFEPETSESTELGSAGRSQQPPNVTGITVSGDINTEMSKFPALEEAIAGVLAGNWGECPLTGLPGGGIDNSNRNTIGQAKQTFTIEKRFPNPAWVSGSYASVAVADAPGATPTITYTGVAATGTAIARVELSIDGGEVRRFDIPISVGDDESNIATNVAAVLNAESDITATPAAGVVNLTTTGTQFDSVAAITDADRYFFQRYKGSTYSVMTIAIAPGDPVTCAFSVVSGVPELDDLPIPGATYQSAGQQGVFTAPQVVELSVGTMLGIGSHCWTSVTLTVDSQNRGITCIGVAGERETVLGTATVTLEGEVYFSDQDVLKAVLNNETIGDGVLTLENADGDIFRFDFYGQKASSASLTAGGTGEDLTIPLTINPTPRVICDNAGEEWKSGLIVSMVDSAPPVP